MSDIAVTCRPTTDGWRCEADVDDGRTNGRHVVTVTTDDADRLAAAHETAAVERLVDETFEFLLEREPQASIMASFGLPVVGRYFPEYEAEIQRRLAPQRPPRRRVSSRAMCEHYIARAAEPFPLSDLWPFTERLERYGLAGFGWGAAWLGDDGALHSRRDVPAFRDDPQGREEVGAVRTTAALVHLRRPSRLSTLTLADTQPFDDPAGRFVLSHNGDLRDYQRLRAAYRAQGRIHGRADTEVGARWLEDAWHDGEPPAHLLGALHDRFGGQANLAVLTADGTPHHYAGNTENPVFAFRLGRIGVVSTGIYSLDRSVFRYVAKGATDRRLIRIRTTAWLDRNGDAHAAS